MAVDIIARGLASSLMDANGRLASDKMPTIVGTKDLTGFSPVGKLTDASLIEGKTSEELLLMMLFGIVNPTITEPKLSITLSADSQTPIIGRKSVIQGSLAFDRGKIDPAYGTSGYRAGRATSYSIDDRIIDSNSDICEFTFEFIPSSTEVKLKYSVSYDEGEQPLNSAGQPFGAPLIAGTIAKTLSITAAYPFFSADENELTFTWFEDKDGQGYEALFASEGSGKQQSFAVSKDVTVVGVKAYDPLAQQWSWLGGKTAAHSLTHFDKTIVSGSGFGETMNQVVYVNNQPPSGERELRVYVI